MNLKAYIYYSTIFLLFSEAFQIHYGIDLKLFYLIIISNLFFLVVSNYKNIKLNVWHVYILLYLTATGILSVILSTNTIGALLEQIVGISITSIYFYIFIKTFYDVGIENIFATYCNFSYFIVLIGFVKLFLQIFIPSNYFRFESIFTEPAHFSAVILPSLFFYFKKGNKVRTLLIFFALLLTISAVAFLGIIVALLLNSKINFKYIFLSLAFSVIFFITAYKNSENFSQRVDDTVLALTKLDVSNVNLSTYALVSNMLVASKSFQANPALGSGLGSHKLSHDKYIGSLTGVEDFDEFIDLNSSDANSLMLRVISDLGLMGVVLILFFLFKCYSIKTPNQSIISKSILIYFFCKLLRDGHYFSPEMYFFVFLYYFNSKGTIKQNSILLPATVG